MAEGQNGGGGDVSLARGIAGRVSSAQCCDVRWLADGLEELGWYFAMGFAFTSRISVMYL